ncbi:MAG TPA: CoA-binding protein, partial [Burkholderiales bacterium]|nr:CoA-binding protein [Burkholderiales bacterium]
MLAGEGEVSRQNFWRKNKIEKARAMNEPAEIEHILKHAKTVAVVGLSSRRDRPSFGVAEYLQQAGYRIIPVNPKEAEVLGEKAYARLEDVPESIDVVDIFRRPESVLAVVESAI